MQAVYTFKDGATEYHIFRHRVGDGVTVWGRLVDAAARAYPSPRFDPAEFAAALIGVCKATPGDVRLLPSGEWRQVAPSETRQRYVITMSGEGKLNIQAFAVHWDFGTDAWYERELFNGGLEAMKVWALKERDGT